jgi:hypothetical protein
LKKGSRLIRMHVCAYVCMCVRIFPIGLCPTRQAKVPQAKAKNSIEVDCLDFGRKCSWYIVGERKMVRQSEVGQSEVGQSEVGKSEVGQSEVR